MASSLYMTLDEASELPACISPEKAARLARISPKTIRALCATGDVSAVKVGRQWRVITDDLLSELGLLSDVKELRESNDKGGESNGADLPYVYVIERKQGHAHLSFRTPKDFGIRAIDEAAETA